MKVFKVTMSINHTSLVLCFIALVSFAHAQAAHKKHNEALVPPTETTTMSSIKQLEYKLRGLNHKRNNQEANWYKEHDIKDRVGLACSFLCPLITGMALNATRDDCEVCGKERFPTASLAGLAAGFCAVHAFAYWHQPDLSVVNKQIKDTKNELTELKKQKVE